MKFLLLFLLSFVAPVSLYAAEEPATTVEGKETVQTGSETGGNGSPSQAESADGAAGGNENDARDARPEPKPGVYSCEYYSVDLLDGWRAVLPPEERQGNISAIFASKNDQAIITPIVGPRGGADAETIAEMFAEQFKSQSHPQERDGQYFFSFEQPDAATGATRKVEACVATQGEQFMVTTWTGERSEVDEFLHKCITSEKYPDLLPRLDLAGNAENQQAIEKAESGQDGKVAEEQKGESETAEASGKK